MMTHSIIRKGARALFVSLIAAGVCVVWPLAPVIDIKSANVLTHALAISRQKRADDNVCFWHLADMDFRTAHVRF